MTEENRESTLTDEGGVSRCCWAEGHSDYRDYHDHEWGRPVADDRTVFEKMCLEGFQSGLSWLTILRKREHFRDAFAGFDFNRLIHFDEQSVVRLLQNDGIVRHRGKIEATINNAHCACEIANKFGSFASYIWQWEPESVEPHIGEGAYAHRIPSITRTSQALSSDLKKRGWNFFGPTTAYAFMQAMGLVNDHVETCFCRKEVNDLRHDFEKPQVFG